METYNKSILQYHDVRLAMDCARDEGREEGIEKEKIATIQKCLQMNIPMEVIIGLTGYSKEQIIRYKN